RERSVAVVVIEKAGGRLEKSRDAVIMLAEAVIAAGPVLGWRVVHKAADKQIELAVVVVIEPDRASREPRCLQASTFRDVGKRAVAIVAIQNAVPVRSDEDVRPTIVVVIANSHTHRERAARDTGLLRDVRECAVAIILVQRIPQRLRWFV